MACAGEKFLVGLRNQIRVEEGPRRHYASYGDRADSTTHVRPRIVPVFRMDNAARLGDSQACNIGLLVLSAGIAWTALL